MFLTFTIGQKTAACLLCALALLTVAGKTSSACSCIGPENAREGLVRTKAVFLGTVVAANKEDFTFSVERVWKGVTTQRIVVRDYYAGTSCAFNFKIGVRYVVFATTIDDEGKTILIGDVCNWTSRFPEARAVVKEIGRGKPITRNKRARSASISSIRRRNITRAWSGLAIE